MTEDDLAKLRAGRLPIGSDETALTIYALVDHIDSLAVQMKVANGFRDEWEKLAIRAVGDLETAEACATDAERRLAAAEAYGKLHELDSWSEAEGCVLWWVRPVEEPPYVGMPCDIDWPGYHTHWTRLPAVPWDERLPDDERMP